MISQTLIQATTLGPSLPLAYQGLQKLYTEKEEWDKLAVFLQGAAQRAVDS
jgi:hypothetical protein